MLLPLYCLAGEEMWINSDLLKILSVCSVVFAVCHLEAEVMSKSGIDLKSLCRVYHSHGLPMPLHMELHAKELIANISFGYSG